MKAKRSSIDYKWVILVVCFLMEFAVLGFCSSNNGLYTVPITDALQIDRLAYSYSNSIRYAVQVLVALSFGTLVSRFGVRKMVSMGLAAMIGSTVLRMVGTNVYHFYLAGALLGFGIVFVGGTMAGAIVRHWFQENIGRYTGIVMSANGVGSAISAQIVTPIINNGETFGYRKAYFLMAALNVVISVVILCFLRNNPTHSPAENGKKTSKKGAIWSGLEYSDVIKKPYFYVTAAMIFLTGISLQSVGNTTIVYLTDLGLSPTFIAAASTIGALTLTFSKMTTGATYDKWGLRVALMVCQISGIIAFVLNGSLTNSTLGLAMAIIATVCGYLALPLETVMIPLLTGDLFGSAAYNKVLGIFMAMNSLGLCLGTPLCELFRKLTGDYRNCFWFFSVVLIGVSVCFQFVVRAAFKQKNAVLAAEGEEE